MKVIVTNTQIVVKLSCRDSFATIKQTVEEYRLDAAPAAAAAIVDKESYICEKCASSCGAIRCDKCNVQRQLDEIRELLSLYGIRQ